MSHLTVSPHSSHITMPETSVIFNFGKHGEIMRIDKDGMTYKGQRIEDAGEAHRAFLKAMGDVLKGATP